jgi:hypothetical protein
MRLSWRSWFWNVVALLCFGVMAALCTAVAVQESHTYHRWVSAAMFAAFALWTSVGAVRALWVSVSAHRRGIVIRSFYRTVTIPWEQIGGIESNSRTEGASGWAGAVAPVVIWDRPGKPQQRVTLNVVGGYRFGRARSTVGNRAYADLTEYLARWRREHHSA